MPIPLKCASHHIDSLLQFVLRVEKNHKHTTHSHTKPSTDIRKNRLPRFGSQILFSGRTGLVAGPSSTKGLSNSQHGQLYSHFVWSGWSSYFLPQSWLALCKNPSETIGHALSLSQFGKGSMSSTWQGSVQTGNMFLGGTLSI